MHTHFRQQRKKKGNTMEFTVIIVVAILSTIVSTSQAQYGPPSAPSSTYPSSSGQMPQYGPPSAPSSTYPSSSGQMPQYGPPGAPSFPSTFPSSSSSSSSCVNSLVPCMNYLNTTRDLPDSCCDPLKEVIKSDQQCLCQLISTQGTFQAQLLGINISQVELLPERCGQRVNPLACLKGSGRNSVENSAEMGSFPRLMLLLCGGVLTMIVIL